LFGTQYCDKKKKKYCNKKLFLSHRLQYPTKVSSEKNVMSLELRGKKKPVAQNYIFIAISFYLNIVYQNVSCEWVAVLISKRAKMAFIVTDK